jgi:hypothetical protein
VTFVTVPEKRSSPDQPISVLLAALDALGNRGVTSSSFGAVAGLVTYNTSGGHVGKALLACVFTPAAVASGRVLAKWIELLEPPRRLRRPRGRGS